MNMSKMALLECAESDPHETASFISTPPLKSFTLCTCQILYTSGFNSTWNNQIINKTPKQNIDTSWSFDVKVREIYNSKFETVLFYIVFDIFLYLQFSNKYYWEPVRKASMVNEKKNSVSEIE